MQKLKTHSGTKDRVRISKNGKVRTRRSHVNHFLQKKSGARKRKLAGLITLSGANDHKIKSQLGV